MPLSLTGSLVTSDHQKIAYRYYKHGRNKVIVIAHGFYNSKDAVLLKRLADNLLDEYDVFMFDFRGHGESNGLYTWTSKENNDLKAALAYIDGKYEKIGMIAFSLGGSVAINTLARGKLVDSLVCVSTVSDVGKIDYQFWKLDWESDLIYTLFSSEGRKGKGFRPGPFWFKKEKSIDNVHKLKMPILYIHGEKDWVIKPWHSQALYGKTETQKKLVIIKKGPHAEYLLKDTRDEFMREVKRWFEATMRKQSA